MVSPLTSTEFEIPERSGQTLCLPSAAEFLSHAAANAAMLQRADVTIAGIPLADLRSRTRRTALALAASYGRELNIVCAASDERALFIGTGHQPFLFHPGIWTKHLLVDRFGSRAAVVNMPVDCDTAEDIGADAPHLDGGLSIVHETLMRVDPDVPYEAVEPPSLPVWQAFLDRLDAQLRTLPRRNVRDVFAGFTSKTAGLSAPDVGSFLTLARRLHEGDSRYMELPVSRLTATPEFRLFFLHVAGQAERFAGIYNAQLEAYRERFNVRTAAQPFPNLNRDGPRIEVPFWVIQGGRRRPLYVEQGRGRIRLWAGGEVLGEVGGTDPEGVAGLALRPKALALTAFSRLCLVDFFVHGVGGGRYDRVTDAVIAGFFGLTPPRYAVVTATLHLPLTEFDPAEERTSLQRRLLELQHNPERLLTDPSQTHRRLIDEKWQLISRLERETLTRRERREITQRIRLINEQLAQGLDHERHSLERRLGVLGEISEASGAATHRGYPFCFFPRRAVDELVDAMVR
ncbi:MAG: hypothetical protein ACRDF6_00045 [bacterium]